MTNHSGQVSPETKDISSTWWPGWAMSRELDYPRDLLATYFYSGRFANFWAARNFNERILGDQQILSSFFFYFCLAKDLLIDFVCPIWFLNPHSYSIDSAVLTHRKYASSNFI